jgi:hypothetical protein
MSERMALVGLDVHQAQTVAAVLDPGTGELRVQRMRGEPASVVPVFLEDLDCPVAAVYEAGPDGVRAGAGRRGVRPGRACHRTGVDPEGAGRPGEDRSARLPHSFSSSGGSSPRSSVSL